MRGDLASADARPVGLLVLTVSITVAPLVAEGLLRRGVRVGERGDGARGRKEWLAPQSPGQKCEMVAHFAPLRGDEELSLFAMIRRTERFAYTCGAINHRKR